VASVLQISRTGPGLKDFQFIDTSQRNAITWADDNVFVFDYISDSATTGDSGDSTDSTSHKYVHCRVQTTRRRSSMTENSEVDDNECSC